ncbi:MAG: MarR family transcriptional regulator [Sumerlaeia bacterium]
MGRKIEIPTRADLLVLEKTNSPSSRLLEKKRVRRLRILKALRNRGALSRSELSKVLGFNIQTTTSAVDELIKAGLLAEGEERKIPIGHRPVPCHLIPDAATMLGVEVRCGEAAVTLANLQGEEIVSLSGPLPDLEDTEALPGRLLELAAEAIGLGQEALKKDRKKAVPLCGAAISWPLPMVTTEDTTRYGPYPPAHRTAPRKVRDMIEDELGVPAIMAHRALAAAIAAYWYDEADRFKCYAYLDMEDPVRAVLVNRGRIEYGAQGYAGQIDSLPFVSRRGSKKKTSARESADPESRIQHIVEVSHALLTTWNPQGLIVSCPNFEELKAYKLRAELEKVCPTSILDGTELTIRPYDADHGPRAALALATHFIFSSAHMDMEDLL